MVHHIIHRRRSHEIKSSLQSPGRHLATYRAPLFTLHFAKCINGRVEAVYSVIAIWQWYSQREEGKKKTRNVTRIYTVALVTSARFAEVACRPHYKFNNYYPAVNGWIAYVRPDLWILCVLEIGNYCNIQITDPSFTVRFTIPLTLYVLLIRHFFSFTLVIYCMLCFI